MKKTLIGFAVVIGLGLSGCMQKSATIDISHAKTKKGYINSNLESMGTLYLYNIKTKKFSHLEDLNFNRIAIGKKYNKIKVNKLRGFDIQVSADVNQKAKAILKAKLENNAFIYLKDARRKTYSHVISTLISKANSDNTTIDDWQLKQIANNNSLRLVLVYKVISASSASFGYENNLTSNGSLEIPINGNSKIKVNISKSNTESFDGKDVPVLVDYKIIRVSKKLNKNNAMTYHFGYDYNNKLSFK